MHSIPGRLSLLLREPGFFNWMEKPMHPHLGLRPSMEELVPEGLHANVPARLSPVIACYWSQGTYLRDLARKPNPICGHSEAALACCRPLFPLYAYGVYRLVGRYLGNHPSCSLEESDPPSFVATCGSFTFVLLIIWLFNYGQYFQSVRSFSSTPRSGLGIRSPRGLQRDVHQLPRSLHHPSEF